MSTRAIFFLFLTLLAGPSGAAPVEIRDFSFEENSLTPGGWTSNFPNHWQTSGGCFEEYITGFSAQGTDHLGLENGASVSQQLAATYQANTRYTLTIAMGNRPGFTQSSNASTYRLSTGGGTQLASGSANASQISSGSFADAPPLVFDTPTEPSAVGQPIRITVLAGGGGRSHFDNLRLDAEPLVPSGGATVTNLPAIVPSGESAILRGEVTDSGAGDPAITIFYGTSDGGTNAGSWDSSITLAGTHAGNFSQTVGGLSPVTTYHFTARATNSAGTSWAIPSNSFLTLPAATEVANLAPATGTATTADPGVTVISTGGSPPAVMLFYGTSDGGISEENWSHSADLGNVATNARASLADLLPDTTYHFRVRATGILGPVWATETATFATLPASPPSLVLAPASSVTGNSAFVGGTVTGTGNDIPDLTIYYGTSNGGTNPAAWDFVLSHGPSDGEFASLLSRLFPTTTYYFTVRATNAGGTTWATGPLSFTTTVDSAPAIAINEIHSDEDDKTLRHDFIELVNHGTTPVDLSGFSFTDGIAFTFPAGTILAAGDYLLIGESPPALSSAYGVIATGPWEGGLKSGGEHVLLEDASGNVVDEVDYQLGFPWPITGDTPSRSIQLINYGLDNDLAGSWRSASPTPGASNSVFAANAAPQIRQVAHAVAGRLFDRDETVHPGESVLITAKVTDPGSVSSVSLAYQIVEPGTYLAIDNPAYATTWTTLAMNDAGTAGDEFAGDDIFTVTISPTVNAHRRLIRYRITASDAQGATITVPYADDPVPNFAYFVHNSTPSWQGSVQSGVPPVTTFDFNAMEPVATYHLLTSRESHLDSQYLPGTTRSSGYGGSDYLWNGALVYEGKVYDHIRYRARGGVWRYAMGKNMWKFDFHRGHRFQARDDYGKKYDADWSKLNFSALIQQGWTGQRGEQGLFESAGFRNHNLAGNPAPKTHYVNFRIIGDAGESGANQYENDYQGLYLAVEQPDGQFLDEHGLPDSYLWKIEGHSNLEPPNSQGDYPESAFPHGDVDDFINGYRGGTPTDAWWREWLDLGNYYAFRSSATWIHDYDIHAGKNYFYRHDPVADKWQVVNWDTDLTWTTSYEGGGTTGPLSGHVLAIPAFLQDYRNEVRHFMDLLYTSEQQSMLFDEIAHWIDTPGQPSQADADRMRWDFNPILISDKVLSSHAGVGRYYESASTPAGTFEGMVAKLKSYVAPRRTFMESNYLDAVEGQIPATPELTDTSPPAHPPGQLTFASSDFSSPVGQGFAEREWRLARVTLPSDPRFNPSDPAYDHFARRRYEVEADWTASQANLLASVQVPPSVAVPGDRVRVRTRVKDQAGNWSHWSAPAEFVVGEPELDLWTDNLVVSELMYHPANPTGNEINAGIDDNDFEFIELTNVSSTLSLDLSLLVFTDGIDFDFSNAAITTLAPGQSVILVSNLAAFEARYGTGLPVAGVYSGALSNSGEQVTLSYAGHTPLLSFAYDDLAPWPMEPDGTGVSLVLSDPDSVPDHNLAASWIAGSVPGGTPGRAETVCPDFNSWRAETFSTGELANPLVSGADADPDGDGLTNLMEFALGWSPFTADGLALVHGFVEVAGQRHSSLSHRRLLCQDNVIYVIEGSDNLQGWAPVSLVDVTTTDNGDGTERVSGRIAAGLSQRKFYRLRVEIP